VIMDIRFEIISYKKKWKKEGEAWRPVPNKLNVCKKRKSDQIDLGWIVHNSQNQISNPSLRSTNHINVRFGDHCWNFNMLYQTQLPIFPWQFFLAANSLRNKAFICNTTHIHNTCSFHELGFEGNVTTT